MVISPWLLRFSGVSRTAETNAVIVGIIAIVLAAWAMMLSRHEPAHVTQP